MKLFCEWIWMCGKKYRYPKVGHHWTEINTHTHTHIQIKRTKHSNSHTHTHTVKMKSEARHCFAEEMKKCLFTEVKWEVKMSIKTARWGQSKGSARPILQDTAEASAKSLSKHHGHPNCSREVKSYHRMVSEQHLQLATHPALGCSVNISVTSYTPRLGSQCERQCDKLHTSP